MSQLVQSGGTFSQSCTHCAMAHLPYGAHKCSAVSLRVGILLKTLSVEKFSCWENLCEIFFSAYSWYFAFVLEFALVFCHCQWVVCFCFGYVLNVACFVCYYCLSCTFVFALALAFAYFAIVNGSVCLFSQEANKHSYNSLYAHMQLLREASTRKFRYFFFTFSKQGLALRLTLEIIWHFILQISELYPPKMH